jgi:hypothetical protein
MKLVGKNNHRETSKPLHKRYREYSRRGGEEEVTLGFRRKPSLYRYLRAALSHSVPSAVELIVW